MAPSVNVSVLRSDRCRRVRSLDRLIGHIVDDVCVVANAAPQGIDADAAIEGIVAVISGQPVGGAIAEKAVVKFVAGEVEGEPARDDPFSTLAPSV